MGRFLLNARRRFTYSIDRNSVIGLVEIGSPGQSIDVQFDTTFNGVMIQSAQEKPVLGGSPLYNGSESTSLKFFINSTYDQTFADGAVATATAATETFNIGGALYSNIPFGQLNQYNQNTSEQIMPFGGASGIIGLNHNKWQNSALPSFMYAVIDQLTGKL